MRITIIGAGPGGYTAAFKAAKKGATVTLIEAQSLGGTCLNVGCVPTKTLKSSAEAFELVKDANKFGINITGDIQLDMPAVIARKDTVLNTLREGLRKTCAKHGINVIQGTGRVISAQLVHVSKEDGSVQAIDGDAVILATGSSSLNLPSLPLDHKYVLNSDDALELKHVPATLIIVGGGIVGCELAFIYSAFGSKVTVVEGLESMLPIPSVDEEIRKLIQREMKKAKIGLELCRIVTGVQVVDGKVQAELGPSPFLATVPESAKKISTLEADTIIVAVGRAPNTQGLGLAEAGIACTPQGYVLTNDFLETSVPNIYAIGDLLGPVKIMLAHMATTEGLVAVQNCLATSDAEKECIDYSVVPSAIFTSPEAGSVGLTEAQAKEEGYNVATSVFQFRELGKAQAMGALPGVFKLIADKATGKLLGAHIAGAHASDLIAELALGLRAGVTIKDIANTIHAHPTLAEGIFEAAHKLEELTGSSL